MSDPLGATSSVWDISGLEKWSQTAAPEYGIIIDEPEAKKISPFPYSSNLNSKVALW